MDDRRVFIPALALAALTLTGRAAAQPTRDLEVRDVAVFSTRWDASATHRATVTFRILNVGPLPVATAFRTRLAAGGASFDVDTPSLASGESVYLARPLNLPADGLLNYTITTDLLGAVAEDDEADNVRSGSFDAKKPAAGEWYGIGPRRMAGQNTGALFAVAVRPTNPAVIFVGGPPPAGGLDGEGIWKTSNGGVTWDPIGNALPTVRTLAIAIDPSAPNRVYTATPLGIYRTEDNGLSWRLVADQPGGARFIIHPTNPDRLFVNGPDGVARSLDRGATWTTTLSPAPDASYPDLALDPTDPDRLLATVKHETDAGAAGLWLSTNGGASWRRLNGCPGGGLPATAGVTPFVATAGGRTYLSFRDGGSSWSLFRTTGVGCSVGGVLEDQWEPSPWVPADPGSLWGRIYVHPSNPEKLHLTGTNFWTSADGGNTFIQEAGGHVDHHGLAFHPTDPGVFFDANDGGVFRRNADATWTFIGDGIQSAHIYDLAVWQGNGTLVVGGFQDNATNSYDGSTTAWSLLPGSGGDGEGVDIDTTGTRLYWMGQKLSQLKVNVSGVKREIGCTLPDCDSGYDFMADPFDPARAWAACGQVWRSVPNPNCATDPDPWDEIAMPAGAMVQELGVDPVGHYVFAGTGDGRVLAARDTAIGSPWATVYTGGSGVTDIRVDPVDPTIFYVGFAGGGGAGRVVRFRRPASWTPGPLSGADAVEIAGGLSASLGVRSIAVDRLWPNRVYVATKDGVHRGLSSDGGATFTWSLYSQNIPPSLEVRDLEVSSRTGALRAATFGQGAFEVFTDRRTHTLQVAKADLDGSGGGLVWSAPEGVSCGADCSGAYDFGATVVLHAVPAEGAAVVGWLNCPAPSGDNCTVNMTADHTVTARFGCSYEACYATCQDACLGSGKPPGVCVSKCTTQCGGCY
jgi:hypothetical protein